MSTRLPPEREIAIPEVLPAVPHSGMVPFVRPEHPLTLIWCGYCAMHGVESFHDISNCDEDYGDRWDGRP